ncbi:hypothetical protein AAEP93_002767 [Penicillium crustosum]
MAKKLLYPWCPQSNRCTAWAEVGSPQEQFGEAQVDHVADVTCYHRKVKSTLTDQRNLIHILLEEKKANIAKFDQLSSSIQAFSICNDDGSHQESSRSLSTEKPLPPLSTELRKYHTLVQRLLHEIDAYQYSLEQTTQIFDNPFFKFRDAYFPAPVTTREQSVPTREAQHAHVSPRESEYDVVRHSNTEEDPYYYHRHSRVHEYDFSSRRRLDPDGSISRASHRGGNQDHDFSSDDNTVYTPKETHDYEDCPHHRRHLVEGELVGAGAAELFRSHSKKSRGEVNHGASRISKTFGAGGLGAVAVNPASRARGYYHRSKSRHRAHSFEDDCSSHRHSIHGRSRRSRSRSHSHSRAQILLELGVGAAAVAAGVASLRAGDRQGRSRTRSRSRVIRRGRSAKDEEQGERSRSTSRPKQALPIVNAGAATAAATGLHENGKLQEDERDGTSRAQHRSRPRCAAPSQFYPDLSRDLNGLVEYGVDPVTGSIPDEHYYRQLSSPSAPYDSSDTYSRRSTRSRTRSRSHRDRYSSSPGSDHEDRRRHRSKKHRSRSREISAVLGVIGLGYAAQYSQHKYCRKPEEREWSRNKERKQEVSIKRFQSCSDNDDAPCGRTRTCLNQNLISHAVSDAEKTARQDGQSEEEGSSYKYRRMNSPCRKLEKSAEYDKVNESTTLTPKTAKNDLSLPSAIDEVMEETLEGLVLQWTNLTREKIEIE